MRKYLRLDEIAIGEQQAHRIRHKRLDDHRDYIISLLGQSPNLSDAQRPVESSLCEAPRDDHRLPRA